MTDRTAGFAIFYVLFLLPVGAAVGLHGWATGIVLGVLAGVGVALIRNLKP